MTDSDTRSPLTAPPLGNPGQSLDEEIHRLIDEEVSGYLLVALSLLFFTLMERGRWWFQFPPQPALLTLLTVVVVAYVARKLFVLRRKFRQLRVSLGH
jgi:hypothetical protein